MFDWAIPHMTFFAGCFVGYILGGCNKIREYDQQVGIWKAEAQRLAEKYNDTADLEDLE